MKRTTCEVVADDDDRRDNERESLHSSLPVLLEKTDGIIANDNERELTQEFSRRRFKPPRSSETLEDTIGPNTNSEAILAVTQAVVSKKEKNTVLSIDDIPRLRTQWFEKCKDFLQGVPEELPPIRSVNHHIPLIDPDKRYNYYLPRCPDALKTQLMEKITRYTRAGWWEPVQTDQAAPMLCMPKKNGKLRTAIDGRKRNDNTVKDVTPFPDQDEIRLDVARARYRSKIDLSDAYEQIRIAPEDVHKTAFATIYGTFVSHTMQIGDCNAPATFQRVMTTMFRDLIGRSVHAYIDDIFVYSETITEHEKHLGLVFTQIRENKFYLREEKCELYAEVVDCLGHKIDERGLHADADKMTKIRDWRKPRNYHDVQKFLGLVQYLAHFLPDITSYTGPIAAITAGGQPFIWRPLHDKCFEMIKVICCKTPILVPIDHSKDEPIWVVCDASVSGVGAVYGQGPTWQTCRPAGFMSRKFTDAQRNYRTFEHETIAILEALLKWEDKLLGYRIHVVTDHKALEFFKTQRRLSSRQTRWMEYLSRFDFDITYVKGIVNKVADALSRYHESDTWHDIHPLSEYVNADKRLDANLEDLPWDRVQEIQNHAIELMAVRVVDDIRQRRSTRLLERQEDRDTQAAALALVPETTPTIATDTTQQVDPTVFESRQRGSDLRAQVNRDDSFETAIRNGYADDTLFSKVLQHPEHHAAFSVRDGLIWSKNVGGEDVLCVPSSKSMAQSILGTIIEQAHSIVGHFGPQRTAEYIRRWYWWPKIHHHVNQFCLTCQVCRRSKPSNQKPAGVLHSLPIPTRPWQSIGMDFIGPFPEVEHKNYLWVVICRMTSQIHLIPITTKTTATELSYIYLKEIVRLHGLPESIVSDRDSKFTSRWWRELHRLLGAKLLMSTSFHPQTDGATERANRSIGQILRSVVKPDQTDWVGKLPMLEFALNASVNESTGFSPFELNNAYMPAMMREVKSIEAVPPGVKTFAQQALHNLAAAHDALIASRVFQRHWANQHRREEPKIVENDKVYLSTKNLSLPKGRASKLLPKFVGPYRVVKAIPETSNYVLELPDELVKRRIVPRFHVSLLRPHFENDDAMFPNRTSIDAYDFGAPNEAEWLVDEIIGHRWKGKTLEFQVRWNQGDTTWEPSRACDELEALDRYLALMGVDDCAKLSKRTA